MTPRDMRIHNMKCSGQGTSEQFDAYNKRSAQITKMERKWKVFQKTLDDLKAKYEASVLAVREQSEFMDDKIATLKVDQKKNCPHPYDNQKYNNHYWRDDWARTGYTTETTSCELCGTSLKKHESSKSWGGV